MLNPGRYPASNRFVEILSAVSRSAAFLFVLIIAPPASAGPPFLTDDPEPVEFRHYEAYVFSTFDRAGGAASAQIPAGEFNWGAVENLQIHAVIPGAYLSPGGVYGLGDMELGVKYRFVKESGKRPQIGVFPLLEIPTGSSSRGLGNGRLWARLPVWIQKGYGAWTTYGGVGYQINHAPGMKDSLFAGWLVQRQVSRRLTLGGETYYQGPQMAGSRMAAFIDAGGYYNFRPNLSLLFMAGHTIAGERHTVGYFGLYYTWKRG